MRAPTVGWDLGEIGISLQISRRGHTADAIEIEPVSKE